MRKFVRTRAAAHPPPPPPPPPPHKHPHPHHHHQHPAAGPHDHGHTLLNGHGPHHLNGHANGVNGGPRREDHHSTLSSRYWSGSEGSRGAGGAAGAVGGGGAGGGWDGAEGGGAPWEDPEFPATWRALGDKKRAKDVVWLRPHEMCSRPTFLGQEAAESEAADEEAADEPDDQFSARWSIEVGEWGDPHVCCAAAALALTPRLLARVAPPHSLARRHSGALRFNFWVFGAWREVVVDDRLPTRAGAPLYSRGALPGDYTLPLLEKAYAKLYGSYAALREGSAARALMDLSGGIVQSFPLRHQSKQLIFQVLNSAVPRSTLVVASLAADKDAAPGRRARCGLIASQAYCVTGLARVRGGGGSGSLTGGGEEGAGPGPGTGPGAGPGAGHSALVRVRAVSGRGVWGGAWAPHSAEWRALPDHDRDLLAQRTLKPGDFWMSFADFTRWFTSLELVHVGPDDWLGEPALHARRPWRAVLARRRWTYGYNYGGPPSAVETTGTNPQFHVQIGRGAGEATGSARGKCHVVVSVTQAYAPAARAPLHHVGFAVYELPPSAPPTRPLTHLHSLRALDVTHECRAREVATFFTLPCGQYLVVPHARRRAPAPAPAAGPAPAALPFLLRVLTDERAHVWEVNEDNAIIRDISSEFLDDSRLIPENVKSAAIKLMAKKGIEEVDASGLRAVLRRVWRACLVRPPSLELCRALVALRDRGISGRLPAAHVPPLLALLAYWRHAYVTYGSLSAGSAAGAGAGAGWCGRRAASSYRLRALLWAAGVTASNKVLECVVVRFARGEALPPEAYLLALARLHLAHERYRALDAKMKSNPLSLEEMILMTIYS